MQDRSEPSRLGANEGGQSAYADGGPLDRTGMLLPADYPSAGPPDKVALVFEERETTFAELDRLGAAVPAVLSGLGIRRGDRVAFLARNNDIYFPFLIGCLRAEAVLVPLNWRCTAHELSFIIEDSGARLLVCAREFSELAEASVGDGEIVTLEGEDGFEARLRAAEPLPGWQSDPEAPALLLFTSGTTGRPKGVVITQAMIADARQNERVSTDYGRWKSDDVLLSAMPNFHNAATAWVLCGISRGLTSVITDKPSPDNILDLCVRYAVTCTFIVPTVVRAMIEEMASQGRPAPPLREVHYGAAPMDVELLEKSLKEIGCGFVHHYGMTEAAGTVTRLSIDDHDPARPHLLRSVGKPIPGVQLQIRRPDNSVAEMGESGEIWIRSAQLMPRYWNRPEATAEALVDGWYRSGDGGYLDDEGYLFLTDRIKDMIVSGGENVYPVEVEAALRLHPAVQDVAVYGLPDPRLGEIVAATVELRAGFDVTEEQLVTHARELVAGYKVPRRFRFDLPLPRTATAKVQRSKARSHALEGG